MNGQYPEQRATPPTPEAADAEATAPTLQAPEAEQAEVRDAYEAERSVDDVVTRIEGTIHSARPGTEFLVNVWHEPAEGEWIANVASEDGSLDVTARGASESDAYWALLAALLRDASAA